MTLVTTRPDATIASGSAALTGAATRHAALSDDSDSSYVELTGTNMELGFAEPTVPSDAKVKRMLLKVRYRKGTGNNPKMDAKLIRTIGAVSYITEDTVVVSWTTPITSYISGAESSPAQAPGDTTGNLSVKLGRNGVGPNTVIRVFEAFIETVYAEKPVIDITSPSGTITTDNQPLVQWTIDNDPDGGPQVKSQVRVFTAAQYGIGGFDPETSPATYDSGEVDGSGQFHQLDAALPDATYRVYARQAQDINGYTHWSDWNYEDFVINVDQPAIPIITTTDEPEFGRIKIHLDDNAGATSTDLFELQRSDDGNNWYSVYTLLTDGQVDPTAGEADVYDYESHNGRTSYYRARAKHLYTSTYVYSDWSSTASDLWSSPDQWWLKVPTDPSLNMAITMRSQPGRQRAARQGVHTPLSAKYPVVVSDVRPADTGEVAFRFESESERAKLDAVLDANTDPVMLHGPADAMWRDRWLSLGDLSEERALDTSWGRFTFDTFSWTEVDRPDAIIVIAFEDPVPADEFATGEDIVII